jgi:glucosamine--fructose-6-phosphate aminotransferase (isomerizing)
MCGIVGYVGGKSALEVVIEGLRRLEYRGYDSAGVAVVADETMYVAKKAGKLGCLEKMLSEEQLPASSLGIGHTRWATHGAPNDMNAHPHTSSDGRIALVHNGIIENYVTLREE